MIEHFWEDVSEYEINIHGDYTPLKSCNYLVIQGRKTYNYRETVTDRSKIKQMLFGDFTKCLYSKQKFDSDTERRFSIIVERGCIKWFKPVKGQFQLFYKDGIERPEYIPDFVVEVDDCVLMVETKAKKEMQDTKVLAKADAAVRWCQHASDYLLKHGGKKWRYLLVPHDDVNEQNTLLIYVKKYEIKNPD